MFRLDSRTAAGAPGITPEACRQRRPRSQRIVADFLRDYCGEYGSGVCRCRKRIDYAIRSHRLAPRRLDYTVAALPAQTTADVRQAVEGIDNLSQSLAFCTPCAAPGVSVRVLLRPAAVRCEERLSMGGAP